MIARRWQIKSASFQALRSSTCPKPQPLTRRAPRPTALCTAISFSRAPAAGRYPVVARLHRERLRLVRGFQHLHAEHLHEGSRKPLEAPQEAPEQYFQQRGRLLQHQRQIGRRLADRLPSSAGSAETQLCFPPAAAKKWTQLWCHGAWSPGRSANDQIWTLRGGSHHATACRSPATAVSVRPHVVLRIASLSRTVSSDTVF